MIKRDNIQRLVRALLRFPVDGMTVAEIAAALDKPPQNIRTALRAMPDVYIDRWEPAAGIGRARYAAVWCAAEIPPNCPRPTK